jgi:hypothetical protein
MGLKLNGIMEHPVTFSNGLLLRFHRQVSGFFTFPHFRSSENYDRKMRKYLGNTRNRDISYTAYILYGMNALH